MQLIWNRVKALRSTDAIKELLEKHGLRMSDALNVCILENNGGKPDPKWITAADGESYDVKHLLSYNDEDIENVYLVIDYFVQHYAGTLLPFAIDSASNYFCEQDGKIVVWTQEDEHIVDVADSFEAFLEGLHD